MKEYFGKKIFGGIAIGKISFYSKNQNVVVRKKTEDSEGEIEDMKQQGKKRLSSFTDFMRKH